MSRQKIARTAGQVDGTDIERRTNFDLRTALDEFLGKKRSAVAVVKRAVDMRRCDRDKARRAHQSRSVGHDAHGHRSAFPLIAGGYRALFIG